MYNFNIRRAVCLLFLHAWNPLLKPHLAYLIWNWDNKEIEQKLSYLFNYLGDPTKILAKFADLHKSGQPKNNALKKNMLKNKILWGK